MKKLNSTMALLIAGLCLLSLTSCAAVVAGGAGAAAAYTYAQGWLTRDYDVSLDKAYKASLETFQENKIPIVEKSKEVASASVEGEAKDQKYWVKLERKTESVTTVSVRAGIMGDRAAAQKIQEEIQANL